VIVPIFVGMAPVKQANRLSTVLKTVHTVGMVSVRILEVKTFLLVKQIVEPVVTGFVNTNSKTPKLVLRTVEHAETMSVM